MDAAFDEQVVDGDAVGRPALPMTASRTGATVVFSPHGDVGAERHGKAGVHSGGRAEGWVSGWG